MRVLVTGGAGFIGSSVVRALLGAGHEVFVIDDMSTGRPENLDPRASFRKLDILDDELGAHVSQVAPDAVVHLAAQASVGVSVREPERDRAINAEGTRRVAAAARDAGAKRVLSASSAAVYGEPVELPLSERSSTAPVNPYGASKLEAEGLLGSELDGTDVDYASMRFSNVYGPRQDAEGEGGVVSVFCTRVREGRAPVVFGDGRQTRDFIYVGDVAGAILTMLETPAELRRGEGDGAAYNISTGTRISVDGLIGAIRQASGYLGRVEYADPREGDIVHSVLDPGKAGRVFGWRSGVALENGIALTWRWFASQA